MPDIIFMLLIFFMVSTVIKRFDGLPVAIPRAQAIENLESRRHTAYIWANRGGDVSIDDRLVTMPSVRHIIYSKMVEDPTLTISLKSDKESKMDLISDLHTELRNAQALKLSYSAKRKGG